MAKVKPNLIFLMGPTASGKSALAFALAEKIPVEIISVDATQVYCGLDIGSAKPTAEEQARIPHHLIDIRDPALAYSAAEFRRDALTAIDEILSRGKTPLLVGGTMLYFNVLLNGLADLPEADKAVRAAIEAEAAASGWPAMHQKLAQIDPETAARLHPNHSQRIARALEIYRVSGQTMTELHRQQQTLTTATLEDEFNVYQFALMPAREKLHQTIGERFKQMLNLGFEQEVRGLMQREDLNLTKPSIRSVGYRQMWSYLLGDYDFDTMVAKGEAATRQLAKRQITWLRSWNNLCVLNTVDSNTEDSITEGNFGATRKIEQIRDQALNSLPFGTI